MQIKSTFKSRVAVIIIGANSDVPVKSCVTCRQSSEYKLMFKWGMTGGLKRETNCSICTN